MFHCPLESCCCCCCGFILGPKACRKYYSILSRIKICISATALRKVNFSMSISSGSGEWATILSVDFAFYHSFWTIYRKFQVINFNHINEYVGSVVTFSNLHTQIPQLNPGEGSFWIESYFALPLIWVVELILKVIECQWF